MTTVEAVNGAEAFILFELAGTQYALRSRDIQQLEMLNQVTPVPNAPAFVDGVVSVRGHVIPAINLRTRFGFPRKETDLRSRLLVVKSGSRAVGMIVDSAREFISISPDMVQPPPEGVGGLSGKYLEGIAQVGDRLVLILDAQQIIDAPLELLQGDSARAGT
jgi:purine-binding chemotaxis protein CheW